jgi:hypothetical protein
LNFGYKLVSAFLKSVNETGSDGVFFLKMKLHPDAVSLFLFDGGEIHYRFIFKGCS